MKKVYLSLFLSYTFLFSALASSDPTETAYTDSVNASYTYQHGSVTIKDGLATISVPKGFKYLDAKQSRQVLSELWGNPPDDSSLGMLFRDNEGPASDQAYAIDITYNEEGHIKDDDASEIDYAELLEQMQVDTEEGNEARAENGYAPVELVGWAVTPFYDKASHKLHWAMELRFGESEATTLNYNIRILGRKGVLVLNAIGDMAMLPAIQAEIPQILSSVEFNDGNTYADFDPNIDNVAAYGIGGLIAGKVLTKLGFFALIAKYFKFILVLLLKSWKLVALALVGLGAGIKKYFARRKENETEETQPVAEVDDAEFMQATGVEEEETIGKH